jgi:hypothetical protein
MHDLDDDVDAHETQNYFPGEVCLTASVNDMIFGSISG